MPLSVVHRLSSVLPIADSNYCKKLHHSVNVSDMPGLCLLEVAPLTFGRRVMPSESFFHIFYFLETSNRCHFMLCQNNACL